MSQYRTPMLLLAIGCTALLSAESRPAGLSIHTWVREDIFAGYMAGDMERLERGMSKLAEILQAEPQNATALAWDAAGKLLQAVKALEAGDQAKYAAAYRDSEAQSLKALELAPKDVGVLVIRGGTLIMMGDRLAEADRRNAFEIGYRNYALAVDLQRQSMDRLPPHFRGELWSGLALAADRLEMPEERRKYIELMTANLQGTPYPARADRWSKQTRIEGRYMCLSCHEPGRLAARLKAIEKK